MTAWQGAGMEEENRVLRSNLLALKRMLLERRGADGSSSSEGGAAPPARQRPRGAPDGEGAQLHAALARAFRECQTTAAERDAWRARCEAQARAAAQREEELAVLRAAAAESELQQRAAARALKKAADFERRLHTQFVPFLSFSRIPCTACQVRCLGEVKKRKNPSSMTCTDWRTRGGRCGARGSSRRRTRR